VVKSAHTQQLANVLQRKRDQLADESRAHRDDDEGVLSPSNTSETQVQELQRENAELKEEVKRLHGLLVNGRLKYNLSIKKYIISMQYSQHAIN
jgi:hypothetical protein